MEAKQDPSQTLERIEVCMGSKNLDLPATEELVSQTSAFFVLGTVTLLVLGVPRNKHGHKEGFLHPEARPPVPAECGSVHPLARVLRL